LSEYAEPTYSDLNLKGFNKIRSNVEYLLEHYPATRGNDLYLQWLYWKIFDKVNLPWLDFALFYKMTEAETITRRRREIQNDSGKYLPAQSVLISRDKKARRGRIPHQ